MNQSNDSLIHKYYGAKLPVQVIRTAPMQREKQKNVVELLKLPLLPQISIMWSFLETYLKKTADVFKIFPETRTILEQRIGDLKDSFKLQAEGKTVDAEMVGANNILVNYLVKSSLVSDTLPQEEKDELFSTLQKVRSKLNKAHGSTPAVIAVDKIDRYVVDLMFMLAESVTKAISDMSDKSWMECNLTIVSVMNVYRNHLNQLLENFHIFINAGELGGATTPSFHAHAMSQRKEANMARLPAENREDDTLLTRRHFERLGPQPLDGLYVIENLEEVGFENFFMLSKMIHQTPFEITVDPSASELLTRKDLTLIVNSEKEKASLEAFLKQTNEIYLRLTDNPACFSSQFLNEFGCQGENDIISLMYKYRRCFDDVAPRKELSPQQRAETYYAFMKNFKAKRRYWLKYKDHIMISSVSEIFASAMMRKMKRQGVEGRIKDVIKEVIPEGLELRFSLTDFFSFSQHNSVVPAFYFEAEPHVWALYGKPILKIAEESLNSHWEKIYYITEAYLRSQTDELAAEDMLQKLDELFGVTSVLEDIAREGGDFESMPSSLLFAGADSGKQNIVATSKNYLRYFTYCFAYARKKKILHLPGLCPRTTIIRVNKENHKLTQIIKVSPICVYVPVMEMEQFERRFGPYELIRETNARFEVIGEAKKKLVVQKTGGECRTHGRPLFHRDKRESLLCRARIDEEPLVEAISEQIKQYVFTSENLCDAVSLYFRYYMREYIAMEYQERSDVSWKKMAEILLFAHEEFYSMDETINVEKILHEAFAKSPHHNLEIGKALSVIEMLKEARLEAIKKISLTQQRSANLNLQIREGYFMRTYETTMETIEKCKVEEGFMTALRSLDLPKNEKSRDHILYIFCVRIEERQNALKESKAARKTIAQDNLDTISFFKIAELIVEESFQHVRQERLKQCPPIGEDRENICRDIDNSDYLLLELISRIIYKFVSESPKIRQDYREAIKYYYENHPFFMQLQKHIAEELSRKSFQSQEYWKALGANPGEGHVGLIEKCILPAEKVARYAMNIDKHHKAIEQIIATIEKNQTQPQREHS
jgi:diadenosine tetraphosphate (Ap4A) HIT family hydrolase